MLITAKDNPKIKRVAGLVSSAKKRREAGLFVLEGSRLCEEALKENISVAELYFTSDAEKQHTELINALAKKAVFNSLVSKEVFSKISDTNSPQGILLTVSLKEEFNNRFKGKWLGFERIADPSNLGAAARTAEALGFNGIILSKNGVDPYSPKSLRASMGALLRIPVFVAEDFNKQVLKLKESGFVVSGAVVNSDAKKINKVSYSTDEIALIGNEAQGLTEEVKCLCDRLITIPMKGRAESLNAAAAATIIMWEMSK